MPPGANEPAALVSLPVRDIHVGSRLRNVDPATVANLQVAILEAGWHGTIVVRPLPDDELGPRYDLVAGAHRLAAMRALGRDKIPATIRVLSDDEALQIEIDENLVRRGLTPLERAEMVAARFAVWRRRFPERTSDAGPVATPKVGRPPKNSAKFAEFLGGAPETMGFTAETAADVGLSKRTIEAAWTTVRGLNEVLRQRLHGTWIAKNEGVLRQLAGLGDQAEQAGVVDVLLAGDTKSVSDARAIAAGNTPSKPAQNPVDETVKAFRKLWGAASPSGRTAILDDLAGRSLPKGWSVREEGGDRG